MRNKTHHRGRTSGHLLLELIIVMSLTAMILSTTSVWVYRTMRYSAEVARRESHARNISRIGHQLRSDAREATSLSASGNVLSIVAKNRNTIEYQIQGNLIQREETGGKKVHHDDFAFAANARLSWIANQTGSGVRLDIGREFSDSEISKASASVESGQKAIRLDAQIRMGVSARESR